MVDWTRAPVLSVLEKCLGVGAVQTTEAEMGRSEPVAVSGFGEAPPLLAEGRRAPTRRRGEEAVARQSSTHNGGAFMVWSGPADW